METVTFFNEATGEYLLSLVTFGRKLFVLRHPNHISHTSLRIRYLSIRPTRGVQKIHRTRARRVLGPGRMKVRTVNFSVTMSRITCVSQLPV